MTKRSGIGNFMKPLECLYMNTILYLFYSTEPAYRNLVLISHHAFPALTGICIARS